MNKQQETRPAEGVSRIEPAQFQVEVESRPDDGGGPRIVLVFRTQQAVYRFTCTPVRAMALAMRLFDEIAEYVREKTNREAK